MTMIEKIFVGALTLIIGVFVLPVALLVVLGHVFQRLADETDMLIWAIIGIGVIALVINLIHHWAFG